ncbi:MAG: alpha/beta fold hydrolase [Desertimonas sp.]
MPIHSELHGVGPFVLWTHGFGSSSHMFAPTSDALRDEHTVVTWDLPGHGRSVVPAIAEDFTVERCLADITELLDAAGAERAVLGGHSLGGYLSLRYALEHPERVAGLVLVGTGPGYRNDEGRARWNEMCEGFARALDERGMAGLGGSAELRDDVHQGGAVGLALAARGILPQHDAAVIDGLASITAPALVVVGDRDRQFLASSEYLATKLTGSAAPVVIEDCGHAPPISRPEAFVAAVRTFLSTHGL